jgi:1-deoxy-D-xylulose-5-phosphate synthase
MQTTFMQRAFDQLLHDVCYMNLPVTVLGVRAGFAGYDGATHHGIYDIPYLRSFPNMQLVYPVNTQACQEILQKRLANPVGPMVILYPYEPITLPEPISGAVEASGLALAHQGKDGLITCLGNTLTAAWQLQQRLQDIGKHFGIVCIQSIKPFPAQRFGELLESGMDVVTLEESILAGGVGSLVLEVMTAQQKLHRVLRMGINDSFIHPGSKQECSTEAGMNIEQMLASILGQWTDYRSDTYEKA